MSPSEREELFALEREQYKRLLQKSLFAFTREYWRVIEPNSRFVDGWHIRAICEHLEAVERFEIQKIIFNMPPRHMKSILISVMFSAWAWARDPVKRLIYASYAQELSTRDSIKTRAIIQSPEYQTMFNPNWTLRDDQNKKYRFDNTATGFRFATSVGGSLTGEGGDFLVTDDPQNPLMAKSEAEREAALFWFSQVFSTRANNPDRCGRIVVMQRLHEKDITGHLLAEEKGYDILRLPAEYDPKIISTTKLNYKDPRINDKDLLWPERFSRAAITELKKDIGSEGSSGQLQQDPKPADGGLFKREWWQFYSAPPSDIIEVVSFIDAAQKPGITNDYSVVATWARTPNKYFLLHLWRDKVSMPILEAKVKSLYELLQPDAVVIEDKAGGSSLIQYLRSSTNIPVIAYEPGQRDKEVRASAATPLIESGICYLPKGVNFDKDLTIEDFIAEHEKFPNGANDDTVDTTSMMKEYFAKKAVVKPRVRSLS